MSGGTVGVRALKFLYHQEETVDVARIAKGIDASVRMTMMALAGLRSSGLLLATRPPSQGGRGWPGYQYKLRKEARNLLEGEWIDGWARPHEKPGVTP